MPTYTVLTILAITVCASFIQRVTGFGFGIVIMTVLPHLMPSYGEATALSGLLALIGVTITLVRGWRYVNWKKLIPIMLTFIFVSFFSVRLLGRMDDNIIKKILGVTLIVISLYFFFISDNIHLRPTLPLQMGMGTVSGLMGGLFAMQGPPAVIYFLSCTEKKEEYTSLTAAYFVFGNIAMTAFRAGNGFITPDVCKTAFWGIPAVFIGLWTGSKVYKKMPVNALRKTIYAFLAFAGIMAII